MSSMLDGLIPMEDDNDSYKEILLSMIKADENTPTKTDIKKPRKLAQLYMYAKWLIREGFDDAGQLIFEYIDTYLVYMISYNRESRKEVISALTTAIKEDRTLSQKLTSKKEGE